MDIQRKTGPRGREIALVASREPLICDVPTALDFMATVSLETGCDRIILDMEAFCPDFFKLRTGLAEEILQKFFEYGAKLAIVGDFSQKPERGLKEFVEEGDWGESIFFLPDIPRAMEVLDGK